MRALPFMHEARLKAKDPTMWTCDTCIANVEPALRQAMGCAWLPVNEHRPPTAIPLIEKSGAMGIELTACPGYSTAIPDVQDIGAAYQHWDKGELSLRVGDSPPRALMDGIEILNAAVSRLLEDKRNEQPKGSR